MQFSAWNQDGKVPKAQALILRLSDPSQVCTDNRYVTGSHGPKLWYSTISKLGDGELINLLRGHLERARVLNVILANSQRLRCSEKPYTTVIGHVISHIHWGG